MARQPPCLLRSFGSFLRPETQGIGAGVIARWCEVRGSSELPASRAVGMGLELPLLKLVSLWHMHLTPQLLLLRTRTLRQNIKVIWGMLLMLMLMLI